MTIKLASNWLNPKFFGFSVCAVVKYPFIDDYSMGYVTCNCSLKTNDGDYHDHAFYLKDSARLAGKPFLRSKYVFLAYDFNLYRKAIKKSFYYEEATFNFSGGANNLYRPVNRFKVRKCGVHLFYAQHEEC